MANEPARPDFEQIKLLPDQGFVVHFVTMRHNTSPHWHPDLEILFVLNGSATVTIGSEKYKVKPFELITMDQAAIHEVVYELPQTMGICIHVSKSYLRRYVPDMELLRIDCSARKLLLHQQAAYNKLCEYLKELTILYFQEKPSYPLISGAMILLVMAVLVESFSTPVSDAAALPDADNMSRIEQVFRYVEQHYQEPIELQDAADELGLNKEYFCRFFKKNTGMSFLQYVSQVRLNHIYQELLYSEGSIRDIMERNGIYNSKLFYKQFKETFGCTPRELKQLCKDNPYL